MEQCTIRNVTPDHPFWLWLEKNFPYITPDNTKDLVAAYRLYKETLEHVS